MTLDFEDRLPPAPRTTGERVAIGVVALATVHGAVATLLFIAGLVRSVLS